jgi:hypothetical protein
MSQVRRVEHEVAQLRAIGAVDHPRVARDDRRDTAPQLGRLELGPSRLPVDRVELDETYAQTCGELAAEVVFPLPLAVAMTATRRTSANS